MPFYERDRNVTIYVLKMLHIAFPFLKFLKKKRERKKNGKGEQISIGLN